MVQYFSQIFVFPEVFDNLKRTQEDINKKKRKECFNMMLKSDRKSESRPKVCAHLTHPNLMGLMSGISAGFCAQADLHAGIDLNSSEEKTDKTR